MHAMTLHVLLATLNPVAPWCHDDGLPAAAA